MKSLSSMWDGFWVYLSVDRKLSSSPHNKHNTYSRFRHLERFFEKEKFNRENFNTFVADLQTKGYSFAHINNLIKLAKHLDRYLGINELQDYTYFREKQNSYEILTMNEIQKLIQVKIQYKRNKAYLNLRNKAIIYFLAVTGCRINEALSLVWSDIQECMYGKVAIFRDTKNGEDRQVIIAPDVAELLFSLPRLSELVFHLKNPDVVNDDLRVRAEKSGVKKKVWCHLIRHSFITHMLVDKGFDSLVIGKIVGHKDPASTQRYNQMDLKHQVQILQTHDLISRHQTLDSVSITIKEFIEKLIDKKRFTLMFKEADSNLVINLTKAYK